MNIININQLLSEKEELIKQFNRAPFKYITIDDFLFIDAAKKILHEFPKIDKQWVDARGLHTRNKWTQPVIENSVASDFFTEVNSKEFIEFLSDITGIENLLEDKNLNGAGYHQTTNGGFLNVHIDFNRDYEFRNDDETLDRRLNLIVYFNENWHEENGGFLELWDMSCKKRIENISPDFNRCVLFETNEKSFHGHPVPVKTNNGICRKSLSVYYYTRGRNDIPYVTTHNTKYVNTQSVFGNVKIFFNGIQHAIRKTIKKLK